MSEFKSQYDRHIEEQVTYGLLLFTPEYEFTILMILLNSSKHLYEAIRSLTSYNICAIITN